METLDPISVGANYKEITNISNDTEYLAQVQGPNAVEILGTEDAVDSPESEKAGIYLQPGSRDMQPIERNAGSKLWVRVFGCPTVKLPHKKEKERLEPVVPSTLILQKIPE